MAILDAELVAGQGRVGDFYRLGPQLARRRGPRSVTFAAFDVLHLAEEPVADLPRSHRRALRDRL